MLKVCIRLELSMGIDIYEMPVTTSDILEDIQLLRLRLINASPHLCLSGIGNVNAPRLGALQQETTSCRRKPHACTGCADCHYVLGRAILNSFNNPPGHVSRK